MIDESVYTVKVLEEIFFHFSMPWKILRFGAWKFWSFIVRGAWKCLNSKVVSNPCYVITDAVIGEL